MTKIIIVHKNKYKERWCPFNDVDVKILIKNVWNKYIIDSPPYMAALRRLSNDKLSCICDYPPNDRPVKPELFSLYNGCIFDLDAYCEGKEDYLKTEVDSLPKDKIYVGGISKLMKEFASKPKSGNWHEKPLHNEIEVALYLKMMLILIQAATNEDFAMAFWGISKINLDFLKAYA